MKYQVLLQNVKTGALETFEQNLENAENWLSEMEEKGVYVIATPLEGSDYEPEIVESMKSLVEKFQNIA